MVSKSLLEEKADRAVEVLESPLDQGEDRERTALLGSVRGTLSCRWQNLMILV